MYRWSNISNDKIQKNWLNDWQERHQLHSSLSFHLKLQQGLSNMACFFSWPLCCSWKGETLLLSPYLRTSMMFSSNFFQCGSAFKLSYFKVTIGLHRMMKRSFIRKVWIFSDTKHLCTHLTNCFIIPIIYRFAAFQLSDHFVFMRVEVCHFSVIKKPFWRVNHTDEVV